MSQLISTVCLPRFLGDILEDCVLPTKEEGQITLYKHTLNSYQVRFRRVASFFWQAKENKILPAMEDNLPDYGR